MYLTLNKKQFAEIVRVSKLPENRVDNPDYFRLMSKRLPLVFKNVTIENDTCKIQFEGEEKKSLMVQVCSLNLHV